MRTFIAALLLFTACNDEPLSSGKDLAVNDDLSTSPDLSGGGCDVVKQDCPQGQKCTVIETGTGQAVSDFATCLPTSGTLGVNDACTRTSIGMDGCGPGLFCTGVGWPGTATAPMRHCNKLCKTASDCLTGQKCEPISDDSLSGLCVVSCDLLSSTCGAGLTCTVQLADIDSPNPTNPDSFFSCRSVGSGAVSDGCNDDFDCGADMFCDGSGACTLICDDANGHTCPNEGKDGGLSCQPFDNTSTLGQCQ